MKAVRITRTGGPDAMELVNVDVPDPAPGEVRIRHTAIGLNYIDTYHRSGLYPVTLPSGLGQEAAGVIEALGAGVKGFKVGDRVAYGNGPIGSYSEVRNIPAARINKLPKGISDEIAAAIMLKGMTARYLLKSSVQGKARPDGAHPCSRRRGRPDRDAMGARPRCQGHRHGRLG